MTAELAIPITAPLDRAAAIDDAMCADSADPMVGRRVGGYRLIEQVGRGAMCTVYRAKHHELGIDVAIKVLPTSSSPVLLERLAREARATWHLDHPNIVKTFGGGVVPEKFAFLVMEYLPGRTLQQILDRRGPLAPGRAARIARQLAAGLIAIHDAGYVHRDLKPGNVIVLEEGLCERVKILDLGIACIPALGNRERMRARASSILGTPAYMAPEQIEDPLVGPAADLYALGAIIYHMLAGRPPFSGSLMEIAAQQLVADPAPLSGGGGLAALAHRLLAKNPAERPESAAHVYDELERMLPRLAA